MLIKCVLWRISSWLLSSVLGIGPLSFYRTDDRQHSLFGRLETKKGEGTYSFPFCFVLFFLFAFESLISVTSSFFSPAAPLLPVPSIFQMLQASLKSLVIFHAFLKSSSPGVISAMLFQKLSFAFESAEAEDKMWSRDLSTVVGDSAFSEFRGGQLEGTS